MGRAVRRMGIFVALSLLAGVAYADIVVGIVLSLSGPAAPVGRAQHAVIAHLPEQVGHEKVRYLVRDDGSDPDRAVVEARQLAGQEAVDLIIGATTVAASARVIDAAPALQIPVISPAAVDLGHLDAKHPAFWAFSTAPDTWLMANAVVAHLSKWHRKRVAFVALDGVYGDQWWTAFGMLAEARHLDMVSFRRFGIEPTRWQWAAGLTDAKPDAVMVVAAGSLAVEAVRGLRAAGFQGPIYQTNAVAVDAFRNACGGDCDGVLVPASPARFGSGEGPGRVFRARLGAAATSFGACVWDAGLLFETAAARALRHAPAGTPAFRVALRDALASVHEMAGVNGVFSTSDRDHVGLDQRAVVLVTLREAGWNIED